MRLPNLLLTKFIINCNGFIHTLTPKHKANKIRIHEVLAINYIPDLRFFLSIHIRVGELLPLRLPC